MSLKFKQTIVNPTEVKGELLAGYSDLFLGQYRYKKPQWYHNVYNVAKSEKKNSFVKLAEKWRVWKEVIDIQEWHMVYFTGISTNLNPRLCMELLMFAADTLHCRIKMSAGMYLLFIIYPALPIPCLNYLVFRLLQACALFLHVPASKILSFLQKTH